MTKAAIWMLLLALTCQALAIENKTPAKQKTIKELGEEIRDRRNLEYSLSLPHSKVSSFRSERRISNVPTHDVPQKPPGALYQGRVSYGSPKRPPFQAPPYAVAMEPMVQYSQKDPLYDGSSDHLGETLTRNDIQAQPKILTVHDHPSDNSLVEPVYAATHSGGHLSHGPPYSPLLVPYYEHPEPIIEIIIKESNESLPAPVAQPLVQQRKKEPVQVFYVKYQQNPHDEKDIIYDPPVPAITPPTDEESDHHEDFVTVTPEYATAAPPPSTTLRAIIKPDSEDYHSNSGIKITFGTEHKTQGTYQDASLEGHEESAPHIAVALPQKSAPPKQSFQKRQQVLQANDQQPIPTQNYQQNVNFQENRHQHAQQRIQFQQNGFPQNYQQLPVANSPSNQFRSQPNQFSRPTAAVFSSPTLVQSHGPPQTPRGPPPTFVVPQNPSRPAPPNFPQQGPPSFLTQGPPNPRPPPQFAPRPDFPPNGPPRNSFPPARPFHQNSPPQQFFNEHEYLQQNYHTITTEQLEDIQPQPFREQHLPNKPPQNFREQPQNFREPPLNIREQQRKPVQPIIPISQEEYNQRYYEQVRLLQQQQQQRQRPQQNQPPPQLVRHQPSPLSVRPTPNAAPPKQVFEQNVNQQVNLQHHISHPPPQNIHPQQPQNIHPQQPQNIHPQSPQNIHPQQPQNIHHQSPQNIHPQPPHPQQPPAFQQNTPGGKFIPPGGELISSVSKYEQHLIIQPGSQPNYQLIPNQQNAPVASPLIQGFPQQSIEIQPSQQIHQDFVADHREPHIPPQISNADLISAYEENQKEILRLQERLRLGEQEQKKVYNPQENVSRKPIGSEQFVKSQNKNYQSSNNQIQEIRGRNPQQHQFIIQSTSRPQPSSTVRPKDVSTTKFVSSTVNSITERPETKKEKTKKPIEYELPDEVPDELRQQLLSSGILENAQISVLDYDKIGDIPLESLPPEQLANFYGAGGGLQIAGSEQVVNIVKPNGDKIKNFKKYDDSAIGETIRTETIAEAPKSKKKEVEMKVVHFDPSTVKGQQVAEKYVQDDAKQVDPVALNDHKYNRYLPLKVNGAHFPLPDVPELKGKKVTSVVVLAPVDYEFGKGEKDGGRSERAAPNKKGISFVAGDALKRLVKTPTVENYNKWLQIEKATSPDLQSVVLLVTGNENGAEKDKEIYMYDIVNQSVSKLSGELSTAFVEVAETNALSKDFDQIAVSDSGIVESSVRLAPVESTTKRQKYSNHKAVYTEVDNIRQADKRKSSESVSYDPAISRREGEEKNVNQVLISSGYSRMKLGRNLRRTEDE